MLTHNYPLSKHQFVKLLKKWLMNDVSNNIIKDIIDELHVSGMKLNKHFLDNVYVNRIEAIHILNTEKFEQ